MGQWVWSFVIQLCNWEWLVPLPLWTGFTVFPHDNDCFISQDSAVYQSLRVSEAEVEDDVIMQSSSSYTPVEQLERMIAQVNCPQLSTPQEVMDAVDDIFMAIPPSKHKALATKVRAGW